MAEDGNKVESTDCRGCKHIRGRRYGEYYCMLMKDVNIFIMGLKGVVCSEFEERERIDD